MKYHFNVPGIFVWISHILLGAYLVYVGYMILNKKPLSQIVSLSLIVIGSIGVLYHLHLWYNHSFHHRHFSNTKKIITKLGNKKYDITPFVNNHPGGSVIKNAANKDLEKVWEKFNVSWHMSNPNVKNVLKNLEIK